MKNWLFILSLLVAGAPLAAAQTASLAKPSEQQLAWHEKEVAMFLHWGPATWQGREYDDRSTPLSQINPAQIDTDQWCRVAQSFGAKMIVFVARHCSGFCWWQTEATQYGIKETAFEGGKGDVLKRLSESCRQHGLKLGVYVYPGSDEYGPEGGGTGGKTKDPAKQEAWTKAFRQMLTEVLTKYGQMEEVWFDGSCVLPIADILQAHARQAVVFQGKDVASLRWVGNERGRAPDPTWQAVKREAALTGGTTDKDSDPDGDTWLPMECDVPLLNHDWFWKPGCDARMRSVDELMEIYETSVGRGSLLLLNATPDTTGRIPESHAQRYAAFGAEIARRYAQPLASGPGAPGAVTELALPSAVEVDRVISMEDIRQGQRIRAYQIEARVGGEWKTVRTGQSMGWKKIDRFPAVKTDRLRLTVSQHVGEPLVKRLAACFVGSPGAIPAVGVKASSEHVTGNFPAKYLIDNDFGTRWAIDDRDPKTMLPAWLEFDLGPSFTIDRMDVRQVKDLVTRFEIQVEVDGQWKKIYEGGRMGEKGSLRFPPVTAHKVRLAILESEPAPTFWEVTVHEAAAAQ